MTKPRNLIDDEYAAVMAASETIGGFLDGIGKTDLATMTETEWLDFIAHAYACVCAEAAEIWKNDVPF